MCRFLSAELLPRQPVPACNVTRHKNIHLSLSYVMRFITVHSTTLSKPQSTVLEHLNYSLSVTSHANLMGIHFISFLLQVIDQGTKQDRAQDSTPIVPGLQVEYKPLTTIFWAWQSSQSSHPNRNSATWLYRYWKTRLKALINSRQMMGKLP